MSQGASAALRIAIVGPAHPLKGGVAVHTTELAHELAEAGHDVDLVSWSHLYPKLLYPGEVAVADDRPETRLYDRTSRPLSWARPDSWVRTGRELAAYDAVVLIHVIPQVVPAHLVLLAAATRGPGRSPRTIALVHNVLPHEPRPGDERLMRALFRRVDSVLVHTTEQATLARSLGAAVIRTVPMPPHMPGGLPVERGPYAGPARLLALGLVRPYKGLEELLAALAEVPGPRLTIAGEAWGQTGERLAALAADPRLSGRVDLRLGYVPADEFAPLLARHDVLCLAYRSGTASQNAVLAHEHGLAVLATRVGSFPDDVRDDVDGLLVPPGDQRALVAALRRLADPGTLMRLRGGVRARDRSGPWANYVGAIEAAAADPFDGDTAPPVGLLRRAGESLSIGVKGLIAAARPRLELGPSDLPEWVRPTDVLALDIDADDARDVARDLGLPRRGSLYAAWAALGGIAAVLRVRDDGQRSALIVDQSGSGSPFATWAKAIGFAPVEAAPGEELDVEAASIDVITRLHPTDAESGEVGDLLGQAAWALRPGGLLITTLALGPADVDGTLSVADLRGVLARADNAGLRLVGDLDGELTERMRTAALHARDPKAAHGLVRLTWRRRP